MPDGEFTRDLSNAAEPPGNNHRGWPKMPPHGAGLATIRDYLTDAAQLPLGYVVHEAERLGQYGSDPMTVTIRTPGDARNIVVRFRNQRDASKPSALRGAFAEATSGASRMKYPKPAEASDFYVVVCALARVTEDSTTADETAAWLVEYLGNADHCGGYTLTGNGVHDALEALRSRQEFTAPQARAWVAGQLAPGDRWTLFVDSETGEQWVRVGEFATYVRHVIGGVGHLGQHTLDALMKEIGSRRRLFVSDRRRRNANGQRVGGHPALSLYGVPTDLTIPTVYASQ
jgi:hypothetical protein